MKTTWFHKNTYEDDLDWINIDDKLPEANKRVKIMHLRFSDWNLEFPEWESEGWWKHDKLWSIKAKYLPKINDIGTFLKHFPVTHWKYIE